RQVTNRSEITYSHKKSNPTNMDSKTVLVTGGAGFIGSHFIVSLAKRYPGWKVINLDNLEYCSCLRHLKGFDGTNNYQFIKGNVCDPLLINRLFAKGNIDIVFHFAAQTHVENSYLFPSRFMEVNAEGTRVLLAAALHAGIERFIYVSTDEVYGASIDEAFDESCPRRPTNPYSISKANAECIALSFWENHKLPVIITRSNNIYGPWQHYEKVIPRFISLLDENKQCTIQGSGLQSRHFLFIEDVVQAFFTVMDCGSVGEIYNIGTDFEIPITQLAKELVSMVGPYKLHRLGWKPRVSWKEGIWKTIRWYEENPHVWPTSTLRDSLQVSLTTNSNDNLETEDSLVEH
uniref:dTDP-D-glucose 4,6-dehydratase n=1 Tax=Denticeps clupeoides TaxID=299321 RepID=A0AAY4DNN8_9TELE